ncbi:Coiled-coil domain-containing protein [Trema orientale]|uniref:Coiled-coil domain-containing protein n=1 Tax=Trema orientale TaxID=63057 RepID=A0A2P5DFR8_TREOI|nr:Coiled-coil domain-containing protein [Trema orientale]
MEVEQAETKLDPDSKIQSKKGDKKRKKKSSEFEFCKVCRLNHDQGQRHRYFPNHKKSLSIFFSRFQTKLADVRFFLKNPTLLRPEHASRNRLWCVFCDSDIDELGSSFACSNAINHLASKSHLKNLKHFLWKYGGGMDCIDNFRILEADVAKWEKKCNSLKSGAVSSKEASHGPVLGPSNDIHNELNYVNVNSYTNSSKHSIVSRISSGVMPLQNHTNEYQVSNSGPFEVANAGLYSEDFTSSLPLETYSGTSSLNLNGLKGIQNLTQIFVPEVAGGNVHTGAPPPWFEAVEESQVNVGVKPVLGSFATSSSKSGKSKKLNPKRVGAAWAEKRKMELEMEKRGELVNNECDANWLPNFGRVWQSGSRRESRKEFELEKQKVLKLETQPEEPRLKLKVEIQPEEPIKIQPYVSKRMVRLKFPLHCMFSISP